MKVKNITPPIEEGKRTRSEDECEAFREGEAVQHLTNLQVLYLPPYRLLSWSSVSVCVSGWVCKSLSPLSFSHFFQHISLKLTGWLTYVSQLTLKAWLSNWIMDFSTQHQLSYVAVCGSMSGSKLRAGDWGVFVPWGLYENFIAAFLAYLGTFL